MPQLVWLVTGCSSGIGEALCRAVLERGDKVIATGRKLESIDHMAALGAATLQLDVTAPAEELKSKIEEAITIYGRVDVMVQNAGYPQIGAVEAITPAMLQAQFETNVFGPLKLAQAIMPHFRTRGSGYHVLNSSGVAWFTIAGMGAYASSKAAVDALFRHLDAEVRPLGIKTLIIQPGSFRTSVANPEKVRIPEQAEHYKELHENMKAWAARPPEAIPGDPAKLAKLVVDLVRGEGTAEAREMPMTAVVGKDAVDMRKVILESEAKLLREWEAVWGATDFEVGVN